MAQAGTIVLGGVGYPLTAGSYRRRAEAMPAGAVRSGRTAIRAFGGGQRQAVQEDGAADRGWDGLGVGPGPAGHGVLPWPGEAIHPDALTDLPTATTRVHAAVAGNHVFLGIGRWLYRTPALADPAWGGLTLVADAGAGQTIATLAAVGDQVILGLGPAADAKVYAPAAGTLGTWRAGERASVALGYQGQLVFAPRTPALGGTPGSMERLRLSLTRWNGLAASDERWLDAPIVSMGLFAGSVSIATRASLWLLGGQPDPGAPDDPDVSGDQSRRPQWRGDPAPVFSHGSWTAADDFSFLLGFGGRLYTWLAGAVQWWDGGGAAGWTRTPVEGAACHGGCVAGGWLVVALRTRAGAGEVWATDGVGWWRIGQTPAGSAARLWPTALHGAGARDVLLFRDGSATCDLLRLTPRSVAAHALRTSGEWPSPLLDAGERGAAKAWRAVGASFAAPEVVGNPASTDPVTVALDWSVDGGATWTEAATTTVADPAERLLELEAGLPGGTLARWLQLRVRWSGVQDWAPTLAGVWADWTLPPLPRARRRWTFAVRCADRQLAPDGSLLPRSGRELAAALWDAWEAGATLPFEDIDHAATGAAHPVRIAALEERIPAPADAGRWGESVVEVEVVEA
jgi:hypothetical protein